jgi:hypothetical protein
MSDMRHGWLGAAAVKAAWGARTFFWECFVFCFVVGKGRGKAGWCFSVLFTLHRSKSSTLLCDPQPRQPTRKKIAATCALLALREYYFGWRHKRGRRARAPRLEGTGITAALMCGLYMWTGMGGLATYALPDNPGAAFKMADIATKSKIWDAWGYSNVEMRG